jgi:hypothetical protein
MNKTERSSKPMEIPAPTGAAAQDGKPKSIADLFEGPIDDARRMASILATLAEEALDSDLSDYGRPDCYHLTSQQREDIMFSIYKVQNYIQQTKDAMEEAIR